MLRSAEAFGASCVAIGPGSADPYSPKAVRASMGAVFGVPVARVERGAGLEELPGTTIALVAGAGVPLHELWRFAPRGVKQNAKVPRELSLLIGSERDGLPAELTDSADLIAHIRIGTHSLNAAMAATVALYEVDYHGARRMTERIAQIRQEAEQAITAATSTQALEDVRIRYLGRKAELPNLLRDVASLPPDQRAATGKAANETRKALEAGDQTQSTTSSPPAELDTSLAQDRIDVTLPADPLPAIGRLHLMTKTRREIEDVFIGLGFNVAEGPEVEKVYYNFDALNHAPTHPSRLTTDTFYVKPLTDIFDPQSTLLRVHTIPMQIRAMEQQPPPIYIIVPGRVYRPDSDATHTPQFHQIEGLAVDTDITLADLQGTLLTFARAIFGEERQVRLRPHFFPFTEPSVEVDVSCFNCTDGITKDGQRCPLCKGTAWIEILGAGMVDPNVFEYVKDDGYDPEQVQGFAFGMGIERIAMLKHGVPDLRLLYDNDIRFLEQFG